MQCNSGIRNSKNREAASPKGTENIQTVVPVCTSLYQIVVPVSVPAEVICTHEWFAWIVVIFQGSCKQNESMDDYE